VWKWKREDTEDKRRIKINKAEKGKGFGGQKKRPLIHH